jgi:hypothetical protein
MRALDSHPWYGFDARLWRIGTCRPPVVVHGHPYLLSDTVRLNVIPCAVRVRASDNAAKTFRAVSSGA